MTVRFSTCLVPVTGDSVLCLWQCRWPCFWQVQEVSPQVVRRKLQQACGWRQTALRRTWSYSTTAMSLLASRRSSWIIERLGEFAHVFLVTDILVSDVSVVCVTGLGSTTPGVYDMIIHWLLTFRWSSPYHTVCLYIFRLYTRLYKPTSHHFPSHILPPSLSSYREGSGKYFG